MPDLDRRGLAIALVGAFVLGVAFTIPAWGARAPAGDDVMAHIVRADYAFHHLFNHGLLDGWFPRFMVGHQEFLLYGPAFTWLLGLIRLVTLGQLSTIGAYKVAGILTFAAFGPALAFTARSLGLTRRAAAVVALLALTVNNDLGVGLHAIYSISLVPQQLGALAFCVSLGCLMRVVEDARRRWIAVGAVGLAVIATSHLITGMALLLFAALALPLALLRAGKSAAGAVGRLALMGLSAAALSGYWILPFLAHHDLRGPVTTWATPPFTDRLHEIAVGHILFAPGLAFLVVVAAVALVPDLRRGDLRTIFLIAGPLAYLLTAHWSVAQWPGNEVTLQLANRGLGYVGALALLPLAVAVARAPNPIALIVAGLLAVGFTAHARSEVAQAGQPAPALVQAAAALHRLVPPGGRFATQRIFPDEIPLTGVSHPDLWLAAHSDRNTLNLFNAESSPSPAGFIAESIGHQPAYQLLDDLGRYGVTHVVTLRPDTTREFVATGGVREVWTSGDVAILEVSTTRPVIRLLDNSAEHLIATTAADGSVPVAWSPKWRSRSGQLIKTGDGLLAVRGARPGEAIQLDFRRDAWDRLGLLVSLLAAIASMGAAARRYFLSSSSWMSRSRSLTA